MVYTSTTDINSFNLDINRIGEQYPYIFWFGDLVENKGYFRLEFYPICEDSENAWRCASNRNGHDSNNTPYSDNAVKNAVENMFERPLTERLDCDNAWNLIPDKKVWVRGISSCYIFHAFVKYMKQNPNEFCCTRFEFYTDTDDTVVLKSFFEVNDNPVQDSDDDERLRLAVEEEDFLEDIYLESQIRIYTKQN